jgi:NAD(P)-dependent dehydrogenase (short-subunit alcohol dehydrogenase family)
MNAIASGTVLITRPTGGLGKAATLAIATRPAEQRPDLLLVGRRGQGLTEVAEAGQAAGATVQEIGCDLARLADVRAAGRRVKDLLEAGALARCAGSWPMPVRGLPNPMCRPQRRSPAGITISVFKPGFMPGTGLTRGHGPGLQKVGRVIERIRR